MEKKESIFKKLFYTGVGMAAITKEKLEETVNKLVKGNKISSDEGKKIIDDFVKTFEDKKGDFEKQMKEFIEKTTKKYSYAKKKDMDDLMKKVEELESYVAEKKQLL